MEDLQLPPANAGNAVTSAATASGRRREKAKAVGFGTKRRLKITRHSKPKPIDRNNATDANARVPAILRRTRDNQERLAKSFANTSDNVHAHAHAHARAQSNNSNRRSTGASGMAANLRRTARAVLSRRKEKYANVWLDNNTSKVYNGEEGKNQYWSMFQTGRRTGHKYVQRVASANSGAGGKRKLGASVLKRIKSLNLGGITAANNNANATANSGDGSGNANGDENNDEAETLSPRSAYMAKMEQFNLRPERVQFDKEKTSLLIQVRVLFVLATSHKLTCIVDCCFCCWKPCDWQSLSRYDLRLRI